MCTPASAANAVARRANSRGGSTLPGSFASSRARLLHSPRMRPRATASCACTPAPSTSSAADHRPDRHRRGRRIVGFVAAAVELGEGQPFGDGLREIGGGRAAADHERDAAGRALTRRQPARGRQAAQQIGAALRGAAADDHHPPRAPFRVGDRCERQLVWLGGKLLRGERAGKLAARGRIQIGHRCSPLALEQRHDQQVGVDGRQRAAGTGHRRRRMRLGTSLHYP